MFKRISNIISSRFGRKDDLSRQLEIAKVFDIYKKETINKFPKGIGAKPISLKNKTLTVQTSSSVSANELRFKEKEVIKRLNQELGNEIIKRVIYRF